MVHLLCVFGHSERIIIMGNTVKNEMSFDRENMSAIQSAINVSKDNNFKSANSISHIVKTGNQELDNLTAGIMLCDGMSERIKAYKAVTLSYIKKNFARLGGKTGCKDVIEYGKKFLNYEKSQINFLIQLADKYIDLDNSMCDTVPALSDFRYSVIKDCDGYTMKIGQLQEIISIDKEKVMDALESGTIDATSTQKELREWKKAVKNTIDTTATETDTTSTETDTTSTETPMTDKERLTAILNIITDMENEEVATALTHAVEKAEKILAKS